MKDDGWKQNVEENLRIKSNLEVWKQNPRIQYYTSNRRNKQYKKLQVTSVPSWASLHLAHHGPCCPAPLLSGCTRIIGHSRSPGWWWDCCSRHNSRWRHWSPVANGPQSAESHPQTNLEMKNTYIKYCFNTHYVKQSTYSEITKAIIYHGNHIFYNNTYYCYWSKTVTIRKILKALRVLNLLKYRN